MSPENNPQKKAEAKCTGSFSSLLTHAHTNSFLFGQRETNQWPLLISHLILLAASCCNWFSSSLSRPKQIELLSAKVTKQTQIGQRSGSCTCIPPTRLWSTVGTNPGASQLPALSSSAVITLSCCFPEHNMQSGWYKSPRHPCLPGLGLEGLLKQHGFYWICDSSAESWGNFHPNSAKIKIMSFGFQGDLSSFNQWPSELLMSRLT